MMYFASPPPPTHLIHAVRAHQQQHARQQLCLLPPPSALLPPSRPLVFPRPSAAPPASDPLWTHPPEIAFTNYRVRPGGPPPCRRSSLPIHDTEDKDGPADLFSLAHNQTLQPPSKLYLDVSVPPPPSVFGFGRSWETLCHDLRVRPPPRLVHVYQSVYADGTHATGFGDFVRGCCFQLHACRVLSLPPPLLAIPHPIGAWLRRHQHLSPQPQARWFPLRNLDRCSYDSVTRVITQHHLTPEREVMRAYAAFLLSPSFAGPMATILFPYAAAPTPEDRAYLQDQLLPSVALQTDLAATLAALRLAPHQYTVVHVRAGDDVGLVSGAFSSTTSTAWLAQLQARIRAWRQALPSPQRLLLLADNPAVKQALLADNDDDDDNDRWCTVPLVSIAHTGEGVPQHVRQVWGTALEWHLMATAAQIASFSVYFHGSGFSQWCAAVYDVPYQCTWVAP